MPDYSGWAAVSDQDEHHGDTSYQRLISRQSDGLVHFDNGKGKTLLLKPEQVVVLNDRLKPGDLVEFRPREGFDRPSRLGRFRVWRVPTMWNADVVPTVSLHDSHEIEVNRVPITELVRVLGNGQKIGLTVDDSPLPIELPQIPVSGLRRMIFNSHSAHVTVNCPEGWQWRALVRTSNPVDWTDADGNRQIQLNLAYSGGLMRLLPDLSYPGFAMTHQANVLTYDSTDPLVDLPTTISFRPEELYGDGSLRDTALMSVVTALFQRLLEKAQKIQEVSA